jgi:hypothetical protein
MQKQNCGQAAIIHAVFHRIASFCIELHDSHGIDWEMIYPTAVTVLKVYFDHDEEKTLARLKRDVEYWSRPKA